jgi:hypothetical protein
LQGEGTLQPSQLQVIREIEKSITGEQKLFKIFRIVRSLFKHSYAKSVEDKSKE